MLRIDEEREHNFQYEDDSDIQDPDSNEPDYNELLGWSPLIDVKGGTFSPCPDGDESTAEAIDEINRY
jgi:hypothetical protein